VSHAGSDELIQALRTLGFTPADRVPLRFAFEADSAREAVDLRGELRVIGGNRVHLVPKLSGAADASTWGVALKTPPTPVVAEAIRQLETEVRLIVRRRPGWRYVGWKPMLVPRTLQCGAKGRTLSPGRQPPRRAP
jgi:hypothetical protein